MVFVKTETHNSRLGLGETELISGSFLDLHDDMATAVTAAGYPRRKTNRLGGW